MLKRTAAWTVLGLGILVSLFALTLAMPVETWRTGQQSSKPLPVYTPSELPAIPDRIWIDADPACGQGARVDPDDCLAIRHLVHQYGISIAGISSVFGNAPLETTDRVARALMARLEGKAGAIPVHRGAAAPLRETEGAATDAQRALLSALADVELTIVALGPLTNVAAALQARPDLQDNVERIVAVMGRRPGHIFHPAEGAGGGILFGHGPTFRDFNVVKDPDAVRTVINLEIPLVLVPYEAAREVEVDDATLGRIAGSGSDGQWVAERARPWLEYWKADIGRSGFYPFDLMAAMFVADPQRFACAAVRLDLRRDRTVFYPFNRMQSLLVEPLETRRRGDRAGALYCHGLRDAPPPGDMSAVRAE